MSLWASYAPGNWVAIAGPSCWALLDLTSEDRRVVRARAAVASDDPVDELLDVLVSDGVRSVPGFAVVAMQDSALRYVVRRPSRVELGGEVITADGAGTWVDGVVNGVPRRVVIATPSAPDAEQPLAVALVGASRLVLTAEAAAPDPAPNHLIDGVPWTLTGQPTPAVQSEPPTPPPIAVPVAPAAPATPPPPPTGRGYTRKRGEVVQPRAAMPPPGPAGPIAGPVFGPAVWAIRCPSGHLTPPYSVTCRVCGAGLPDQPPVQVPRPVLGRLVLSTGGTILLDRGIVLGRAPRAAEGNAADRPHLVRLAESPEISRTHAEIRLDGWQVLLRDLGSANGTTLAPPGGVVEQIRAHEDYVLEPGSVVSLADVVTLRFEVSVS